MAGDLSDYRIDPYDIAGADYLMARDLASDAVKAASVGAQTLPRRIHYYAFGGTGFSMNYLDESGAWATVESSFGRVGFDEMPAVATAIIPEGQRAAVELYNATLDDEELHCAIFVNGIEVVSESDTGPGSTMCNFETR